MTNKKNAYLFAAGIYTVIAATLAVYSQLSPKKSLTLVPGVTKLLMEADDKTRVDLEKEINRVLSSKPIKNPDYALIEARFTDIEHRIEDINEKNIALRQAINPIKPEEILTIARLTDEVKSLEGDFKELKEILSSQQKNFQSSIIREIDSSSQSTSLILVVLLPLVANFLYTIWKDIKKPGSNE